MSTATVYNSLYEQQIVKPLSQTNKELPDHFHTFYRECYDQVKYSDCDIISKFIPDECKTMIELNSNHWNRRFQFILEAYLYSVIQHQWTTDDFMRYCQLFSAIPKSSKPWQWTKKYLQEHIQNIAQPLNSQTHPEEAEYKMEDDYEDDDKSPEFNSDESDKQQKVQKHDIDRILYYIFQVHELLHRLGKHQQIDLVFIPKLLADINDASLKEKGIKVTKLGEKHKTIHDLLRNFSYQHDGSEFCRGIMLIIPADDINEDSVYLFEWMESDVFPADILNYTEMPLIWNTKHIPSWLHDAIQKCNGIILSYHHHVSPDKKLKTNRLYLWYRSLSGQCYGSRVLKENMINVLRVFCHDVDGHVIDQYWDDEAQFKDVKYSSFISKYFKELMCGNINNNGETEIETEHSIKLSKMTNGGPLISFTHLVLTDLEQASSLQSNSSQARSILMESDYYNECRLPTSESGDVVSGNGHTDGGLPSPSSSNPSLSNIEIDVSVVSVPNDVISIDHLPVSNYRSNGMKQTCVICCKDIENGDEVVTLPCCHIFHNKENTREWLQQKNSCPICRNPIYGNENDVVIEFEIDPQNENDIQYDEIDLNVSESNDGVYN